MTAATGSTASGSGLGSIPRRIDRWIFSAAPPERLAVFRILLGLFASGYLVARLPEFLAVAGWTSGFEPVGVLWFMTGPLPALGYTSLVLLTVALGVGFASGVGFRFVGPTFAISLLIVATYRSSWGRLLYFDNLLVIHCLIIGFSAAADARPRPNQRSTSTPDVRYGWPLRLCALVMVVTYLLAGLAKLRIGGLAWLQGESLQNHIAFSAARLKVLGSDPSPLARRLMTNTWLLTPLATAVVIIELAAPVCLFRPLRSVWVGTVWLMHLGIAAVMFVVFPYPLLLVAFAPLYDLEHLPSWLAGLGTRGAATPG